MLSEIVDWEYIQVFNSYGVDVPKNIFKIRKIGNNIMLKRICLSSHKQNRYSKLISVLKRRSIMTNHNTCQQQNI